MAWKTFFDHIMFSFSGTQYNSVGYAFRNGRYKVPSVYTNNNLKIALGYRMGLVGGSYSSKESVL